MGKKKDAKEIAKRLSSFMQENKFTVSDINRGLVVLLNMERDYKWEIKTKSKKVVEFEECTT